MEATMKQTITVENTIDAPIEKVWAYWTLPEHITQWNQASDDWHCPAAANDPRTGKRFLYTMAAKDGSFSFDFSGEYKEVRPHEYMEYRMDDGRFCQVYFTQKGDKTRIVETFEPEEVNPLELQQGGWQAILDNFKKYTEQ
jgi:uncharacterized protein YndB with AHSA1/START domain